MFNRPEGNYAPLAQLVEQLTLNQWVLGSNPRWCTKQRTGLGNTAQPRCKAAKEARNGPLVKRLRRRPLTPQTGVRFSHGSPVFPKGGAGAQKIPLTKREGIWYYCKAVCNNR